jgi:Zn-dependent protease
MLGSWRIGTAFGIDIHVHWTFLLLPLWLLFSQASAAGWEVAAFLVSVVTALFGCVVLHELGHALAARRFGIRTRDITLYPIGGVARLERIPEKPFQELAIAVAGPAVNVVIAIVMALVLLVGTLLYPPLITQTIGGQFLYFLMLLNVLMVLFNLVPAFPMDGGRVLRAILSLRLGHLRATRFAVWVGGVIAIVAGPLAALYWDNPWFLAIAAFVFFVGQRELQAVEMRERVRAFRSRPVEAEVVEAIPADIPTYEPFALRPQVTVWVWDNQHSVWIKQANRGFDRAF